MYRLKAPYQCVLVKNRDGGVDYHYLCGIEKGQIIPWLNDVQREMFLREGVVEEILDPAPAQASGVGISHTSAEPEPSPLPELPPDPIANGDQIAECITALDGIPVPTTAGRPTCEHALRSAGFTFGNNVIAGAVKQRKSSEAVGAQ
jgi:cytochrome c oxidase cbb3-type subunit II